MSKPQLEKMKHHLPSSPNLTLNNNTMFTSTLGKLLVRKLTHRSTIDMTKSTNDLNNNYKQYDSLIINKNIISKDNIQFIERIHEGKFGTVFKAFYRTKQNELLTIIMKKYHSNDISKEVYNLQDIKHPHIVEFFGIVTNSDNSIMFVIEYVESKSLYDCLISLNAKCQYTIEILLEFLKQITLAMSYLEKKFFIHKNLSCKNFLVFNKSLIKLSDLTFSCLNISWNDKLNLSIPWMSPELIHFRNFTTASDIYSFGISMWECFTYGQIPWKGMTNDQIINIIDTPNHQRLSRPSYATSELYQIMLDCWKYEPSERPTFTQLEKKLNEIELKQVRWKNTNYTSINLPDDFLSIESCLLGPLIILDRCLHISNSSSINNIIQCISADGEIGFVYNDYVEPLHVIPTMNHIFNRKTVIKRNSTKTKFKQISKDMISSPQLDFIHKFHIGIKNDINDSNSNELSNNKQTSSLFDEVMQAFTEICSETDSTSISSQSPIMNFESSSINIKQFLSDNITEKSDDISSQFIHELEKHVYISNSSSPLSTNDEHSLSSSNQEKSDCHSHYSSISTDNDDNNSISSFNSQSLSINKIEKKHSITGQPLPPPPDLLSLGRKLTTATMTKNFQVPSSLISNKYRIKKRFNLFT